MDFLKIKPAKDFEAVVTEIEYMTEDVIRVMYELVNDGHFDFEAGQFVNLKFEIDGEPVQRAYSVASAPVYGELGCSGFRFELCVKIVPEGKAGRYFNELSVGDVSKFKGPFGFCTLPDEASEIVLVGTGTGLAPIKGILEDIEFRGLDFDKVTVLFGVRLASDVFYLDILEKFAELWGDRFEFKVCLSREDVEGFENGRVTAFVEEFLNENCHLYLCGSSAMIKEVREMGLSSGIDKSRVHVEIFD